MLRPISVVEFQSHAGSIEPFLLERYRGGILAGFNPTLVRLSPSRLHNTRCQIPCFNPTLVRLSLQLRPGSELDEILVSIPRWFD